MNSEALELTVVTEAEPNTKIVVQISAVNDLPNRNGKVFLPKCAIPEAIIRLWGNREQTGKTLFIATDIRGCRNGGCTDPTGIRSRLRKIRTHHYTNADEGGNEGADHSGAGLHGEGGAGNGQGGDNSEDMDNGAGRGGGNSEGGGNGGGGGGNR